MRNAQCPVRGVHAQSEREGALTYRRVGPFELRRKGKARLIQSFKQAGKIGVLWRFCRLIGKSGN